MKLHGNAALSWSGRRLLVAGACGGVDADGGGRGRRGQRALRTASGWAGIGCEGERGLHDAPRRRGGSRIARLPIGWRRSSRCASCG